MILKSSKPIIKKRVSLNFCPLRSRNQPYFPNKKVYFYQKNLERIVKAKEIIQCLALADRHFKSMPPGCILNSLWPQIIAKMNVFTTMKCIRVCRRFKEIIDSNRDSFNRTKTVKESRLNIDLFSDDQQGFLISFTYKKFNKIFTGSLAHCKLFLESCQYLGLGRVKNCISPRRLDQPTINILKGQLKSILDGIQLYCNSLDCNPAEFAEIYLEHVTFKNFKCWRGMKSIVENAKVMEADELYFENFEEIPTFEFYKNVKKVQIRSTNTAFVQLDVNTLLNFVNEMMRQRNYKMRELLLLYSTNGIINLEEYLTGLLLVDEYRCRIMAFMNAANSFQVYLLRMPSNEFMTILIQLWDDSTSNALVKIHQDKQTLFDYLLEFFTFHRLHWNAVDFSNFYEEFMETEISSLQDVFRNLMGRFPYVDRLPAYDLNFLDNNLQNDITLYTFNFSLSEFSKEEYEL